jgi:hypothetical protein
VPSSTSCRIFRTAPLKKTWIDHDLEWFWRQLNQLFGLS